MHSSSPTLPPTAGRAGSIPDRSGLPPLPPRWERWTKVIGQVFIVLLGGAAILMTACDGPLRAWGFLLGLASQPLWLVATWQARQWGMFFLSLWYCLGWGLGVWRH